MPQQDEVAKRHVALVEETLRDLASEATAQWTTEIRLLDTVVVGGKLRITDPVTGVRAAPMSEVAGRLFSRSRDVAYETAFVFVTTRQEDELPDVWPIGRITQAVRERHDGRRATGLPREFYTTVKAQNFELDQGDNQGVVMQRGLVMTTWFNETR